MDTLGNRFHVNFLGYAHWFVSIRISQMKDHYISVDQVRYTTSIVAKYLDTATVKASKNIIRPLYHLIIYSPNQMYPPVMNKLISLLGNTTSTTEIA